MRRMFAAAPPNSRQLFRGVNDIKDPYSRFRHTVARMPRRNVTADAPSCRRRAGAALPRSRPDHCQPPLAARLPAATARIGQLIHPGAEPRFARQYLHPVLLACDAPSDPPIASNKCCPQPGRPALNKPIGRSTALWPHPQGIRRRSWCPPGRSARRMSARSRPIECMRLHTQMPPSNLVQSSFFDAPFGNDAVRLVASRCRAPLFARHRAAAYLFVPAWRQLS